MKSEFCSAKFEVYSVKCGVRSVKRRVLHAVCGMWSVECGVGSVKSEVGSEECGV